MTAIATNPTVDLAAQTAVSLVKQAVAQVTPKLSTAGQTALLDFAGQNPQWASIITEYTPAFWVMADSEIVGWIALIAKGQTDAAYRNILAKLPNADLLAEEDKTNAAFAAQNRTNAANMATVQRAVSAVLGVLVSMALAAVKL